MPGKTWRPTASLARLKLRAELLARIRTFFSTRGVLEVETPILSRHAATDPHLNTIGTVPAAEGAGTRALYLHTSPEFAMKRLLASGSGSIYQLCHVFRAGERGRWHNPEFTLLEWYRPEFDHHALMQEVADLVSEVLVGHLVLGAVEKLTYREAFEAHTGIDPHRATAAQLATAAAERGIVVEGRGIEEVDAWRDLLLTHLVEPHLGLGRLTFLYDYPASQAALARIRAGDPAVASRFELYLHGIELANGFHELGDLGEQRARFERDNAERKRLGLPVMPVDELLLAALAHGLPSCAGVALGVDRLVMLAAGSRSLEDVIAFPIDRA
ncbi:lysyl-tRNA synthetase [Sulfurifustis variabilis]|uniref:Lysyl-tRNA synthetase n=1 Tax=Sulfurifustis variabilis TaxID=1675686 RepID=A0A1B4VCY4_9GAMM|nr:EF-P lysine aminoacylase EpmA [Sulfurifustis variabilis]BAU49941.1 lysyl-tRNA synthetase [Sulfurifustis variabilis]